MGVPFLGVFGTHFSHGVLGPASETDRGKEYLHASAIFSTPELPRFGIVCPELTLTLTGPTSRGLRENPQCICLFIQRLDPVVPPTTN